MKDFTLLFIQLTCLVCLVLVSGDNDGGKTLPMEEWLDPGDMFHYDADRVLGSTVSFVFCFLKCCLSIKLKFSWLQITSKLSKVAFISPSTSISLVCETTYSFTRAD